MNRLLLLPLACAALTLACGHKFMVNPETLHLSEKLGKGSTDFSGTYRMSGSWLGVPSGGATLKVTREVNGRVKLDCRDAAGKEIGGGEGIVEGDTLYVAWGFRYPDLTVVEFGGESSFEGVGFRSVIYGEYQLPDHLRGSQAGDISYQTESQPRPINLGEGKSVFYKYESTEHDDFTRRCFGTLSLSQTALRWNASFSPERGEHCTGGRPGVGLLVGTRMYVSGTYEPSSSNPTVVGVGSYMLVGDALEGSHIFGMLPRHGSTDKLGVNGESTRYERLAAP